jgi:hypothetical protein
MELADSGRAYPHELTNAFEERIDISGLPDE